MTEPIRYYSTNRHAPRVTLDTTLLQGQAPDRGLYLPERIPTLTRDEIAALTGRTYPEIAHVVLRRFTAGVIDDDTLLALCRDAYNFDVPLEHVTGRLHLMRLDRGPTASFKDFAARMMARWMSVLMTAERGELVILTATSGDTGGAVAHAYHRVPRVKVVVLFPIDEVSDRQRRQMTTLGGNVTAIAVDGKFDDCQAMVKRAFADPELRSLRLTSANSINIGRLLPQAVYYVYAYVKLADVAAGEPIVICVPSGNFGNMMGAVIAGRMGVPIRRLVVATNANDEVPVFWRTERYEKIVPSRVCISNAMNVGHPSNLARLVDLYGGWMDETGLLREPPDMDALRRDIYTISIDDDTTRATIQAAYQQFGIVLEPHGAVAWAGLQRFLHASSASSRAATVRERTDPTRPPTLREGSNRAATVRERSLPDDFRARSASDGFSPLDHPDVDTADPLGVCIETAHPAKFPDELRSLIALDPSIPPSLVGLDQKAEHFERVTCEYKHLGTYLKAILG